MNNEFNINAVKVVKTTAGDHLYIRLVEFSCPTWLLATIKHKNLAHQCARLIAIYRKPTNRAIPQNWRFQKAKHQNIKRCSPTMHQNPTNKVKTLRDSKTSSPKLLNTFPSGLIHGTIKCIWIRLGIKEHTENCDVWSRMNWIFQVSSTHNVSSYSNFGGQPIVSSSPSLSSSSSSSSLQFSIFKMTH